MRLSLATALMLTAAPALAITTIGTVPGGVAAGSEGIVSNHPGITEERLNSPTLLGACSQQDPVGITIVGQAGTSYNLGSTTIYQRRLDPSGDTSCYLAVNPTGQTEIEFSNATATTPLTYLGFYWGSMDEYNEVTFLDVNGFPVAFSTGDYTLTGEQVANLQGAPAYVYGSSPYPSNFTEFTFDPNDQVKTLVLETGNYAFEIDNLAYTLASGSHLIAASEPASLALIGIGCVGLSRLRRRPESPA